MNEPNILKRALKTPSTRSCLRKAQAALRDLRNDLAREWRFGRELRNHCRGKKDILLNIGCGELVRNAWVNIDFQPRVGVFYYNALNTLPIDDNSVKHIHAEHFLEHLRYDDAVRFLAECRRVLRQDGTCRIIVPDAEKYMRAYTAGDRAFFEPFTHLGDSAEPLPTAAAICNQMFHMAGDHYFGWDFETLEYVTKKVGFASATRSSQNDLATLYGIDGQDWWRAHESLYVNLRR
jgi:predicted SAM-dependent methyltransferase